MLNYAVRMRAVAYNPFLGLGGKRSRGSAGSAPPTVEELEALRDGCDALGSYGSQMRDFLDFAGLTLMRPGELFELRYSDIDFRANRIVVVAAGCYRGRGGHAEVATGPRRSRFRPRRGTFCSGSRRGRGGTGWCSSARRARA